MRNGRSGGAGARDDSRGQGERQAQGVCVGGGCLKEGARGAEDRMIFCFL